MTLISKSLIALSLAAASVGAYAAPASYGEAGTDATVTRTVTIGADTKWVNVTEGDVVKFNINGKEVTWQFDGASLAPVDLAKIAPDAGRHVTIYIQPMEVFSPEG